MTLTKNSHLTDVNEMYGSFYLNSSEFAFAVKDIQEVVNPPSKFTSMPLAPDYLLGIFNLRGAIIPVIDLKKILQIENTEVLLENKKIAIITHDGVKLGLLFDNTGQIFRNRLEEKSDFNYQNNDAKQNVISGAIKLDEGKRIIQILDVRALVRLEKIPRTHNDLTALETNQQRNRFRGSRLQCISFMVAGNRFGLGIDAIQEIIAVPKLNETALASDTCIGMFDLRGDVVPVVDFSALLKYRIAQKRSEISDEQRIIIMKIENEKFGLLIDSVDSIITYYGDEVLNLPILATEKIQMFAGCLSRENESDIILFNHTEILSSHEINEITQGHSKIYQASATRASDSRNKKGLRKSYITFKIENLMALEIGEVKEIIEYPKDVLQPPGLPVYIRGMLNLRGHIVTILDTQALFNAEKKTSTVNSKILVTEKEGVSYGIIVESVESIITFAEEEKLKLPEGLYRDAGSGISGSVKFAVDVEIENIKKTLLVLNLHTLIDRVGLSTKKYTEDIPA